MGLQTIQKVVNIYILIFEVAFNESKMKRTRSVAAQEEKEDEEAGCPSKKTLKMRSYRNNVKNDP